MSALEEKNYHWFFFFFFQGGFTLCTEITPCLVLVLIFMVTSLSKTKPKKCNFFCLSCEEWNWELTGINCFQRLAQQLSRKTSREQKYGRAALAMIFESKITAEKQNQKLRCVRTKLKKKKNRCWVGRKTRDSCWFFVTLQIEHVIFWGKMKCVNQQISTGFSLFLVACETSGI